MCADEEVCMPSSLTHLKLILPAAHLELRVAVVRCIPVRVITICAVPLDRDYEGVYAVLGPASSAVILTETDINPKIPFPVPDVALDAARKHNPEVSFAPNLSAAVEAARARAGQEGSILLSVAQPLVGEALMLWNLRYEVI